MPRTDIDYSNTLIYKLVCRDVDIKECYVGHTTNFSKRKQSHKKDCTNKTSKCHNIYVYQFIREHGGWDNWDMIVIEQFECNDKHEACARERYWIETMQSRLNKIIPTRTKKEYREETKEQRLEYQKEYYEANKERRKEYTEANKEKIKERISQLFECECGSIVQHKTKARHLKSKKHQDFILER